MVARNYGEWLLMGTGFVFRMLKKKSSGINVVVMVANLTKTNTVDNVKWQILWHMNHVNFKNVLSFI